MRASVPAMGFLVVLFSAIPMEAAEPLAGRWLLVSQEIAGQKKPAEELMLRINPAGKTFEFAYSVPVNDIQFVSLKFSARLDGTEADVTNANGQKIGIVKVTKSGASQYKIVLQGHDRPSASGFMTVSADGKTLRSESDSSGGGQAGVIHTVQIFARQ
jgi:hypothetical protein